MPSSTSLHVDSLLAHGGGGHDPATGAVIPPIPTATTFARDEDYNLISGAHLYSRDDNDLFRKTEGLLAALDLGADSRLFASGMAAIAAVIRSVKPGGTILAQSNIYYGATAFLRQHCAHSGIALVESDAANLDVFKDDLTVAKPDLVWLEVPSNPYLKIADIPAISDLCKKNGALLAVDATAATPLVLKPLPLGADLVMHSATKALNGHSDLLGGVVTVKDASSKTWEFICNERKGAGSVMGSFEAWLLLRGLRTLSLRIERMNRNAQAIAEHLAAHPKVERVLYPGLPADPGHERARAHMTGGYGSLMSVQVKGTAADALKMVGALSLIQRATSLGGVESVIEHRHTIEGETSGIPANLLRLSVGIEHPGDLIADLDNALSKV